MLMYFQEKDTWRLITHFLPADYVPPFSHTYYTLTLVRVVWDIAQSNGSLRVWMDDVSRSLPSIFSCHTLSEFTELVLVPRINYSCRGGDRRGRSNTCWLPSSEDSLDLSDSHISPCPFPPLVEQRSICNVMWSLNVFKSSFYMCMFN